MKYDLSGQSTPWPIATKEHSLLFILLVYQDADIKVITPSPFFDLVCRFLTHFDMFA